MKAARVAARKSGSATKPERHFLPRIDRETPRTHLHGATLEPPGDRSTTARR
jgi:hypothetical protein